MKDYDMSYVCFTYPEVAAGIQTVLQSSTARDGIYITMDVGAGTVDMNAFLRFTGRRDCPLSYLACRVVPLGAQRLISHAGTDPYESLGLPGCRTGQFPLPCLNEETVEAELRSAIRQLIESGKQKQPNLGNMDGMRTWDNPNVYIWGGGSALPLYGQVLQSTLEGDLRLHQVDVMSLPSAHDLVLTDSLDFGRIAIGYGLSYHPANLDRIRLPSAIPNRPPPQAAHWRHPQELHPGDPGFSWTLNGTD